MKGINKVILVGNLGKDPEVRYLESKVAVCNFSLATSESYKDKTGNWVEQTEWHNIVLWRGLAEVAEKYLKKGSRVYLEGKIRTRSYDDKDGNKKYITEIVGDNMVMLDSRQEGMGAPNSGGYQQPMSSPQPQTAVSEPAGAQTAATSSDKGSYEDDLPF